MLLASSTGGVRSTGLAVSCSATFLGLSGHGRRQVCVERRSTCSRCTEAAVNDVTVVRQAVPHYN